jgi:NAD+ synthase (glutamine-hydrolysing)
MRLLRVAAGVLNQTPLDWRGNLANIRAAIGAARAQGATLLCLPELCITGYGCEDAFHSRDVQARAMAALLELRADTRGMAVSVGLPVLYSNALFNAAALLVDGGLAGCVCKHHLAGEGLHYEPRWFKAWPQGHASELEAGGDTVPIGDIFFDVGGVRIGFEICEDAWVAQRPGGALSRRGVDVILNPSASHFAFGKLGVRTRFVVEGSRAFGVTYVYSNYLGNEAGRAIYDGGALIASGGALVAAGPRFTYHDALVTSATVDLDATRTAQSRLHSFEPSFEATPLRVAVACQLAQATPVVETPSRASWELSAHLKEEEFTRAMTLALFDYMRKSRSRGFVVSLSGGADSSAAAVLVGMMTRLALGELGPEEFRRRVPHAASGDEGNVGALLTTVYQSTRHSGVVTREAARRVAGAVGARHLEFDVDGLVQGYTSMVQGAMARALAWDTDDIALQNIQARTRGPGVWMVANILGALLLATSNRSEAAVGYATMDGDTCGGLSPLAGIDKAFLRAWLRWVEKKGPEGLGPLPELDCVNRQQPTAELRPAERHQTDEDDLMPYDVLETIEDLAVLEKRPPVEVWQLASVRHPAHERRAMAVWVERFFRLWCRNQWKRERYAISFHVDDKNLDPKTWCRFPVLSGGYEAELEDLRRAASGGAR